ncbi:hypothetical protein [Microlunatus sp. Gsoil 973]|uniref:hypothetical protein n=1 Tax=Microlunatus sp. Gsoil 973 TaxID=2672569 RepID=UPI0012B48D46|nr:hypothetical protein [Microlunatus sp. Gsoil 973]QGN32022.1 hypothetical protein GJV80_03555 [Microlunatus sp. Gsoil 973]
MTERVRSGLPHFTGIHTYQDPQGRFEFRHPWGWQESELEDDRDGVIVSPEDADNDTWFAVWVTALDTSVEAADLPVLKEGFDAGLARLAGVEIQEGNDKTYNNIVRLERVLIFTEGAIRRKRRVWALYADQWQFVVAYQGATEDEYAYWLPMGNYCFTSFNLPSALWFATDPAVYKRPGRQDPGGARTGC